MMPDDLSCVKVEWENQLQEISKELTELGGQSIPLMWNLPMVLSILMRSHGTLTWKWGMPIYFATCDSSAQRFLTRGFSISWLNLCPCQWLAASRSCGLQELNCLVQDGPIHCEFLDVFPMLDVFLVAEVVFELPRMSPSWA